MSQSALINARVVAMAIAAGDAGVEFAGLATSSRYVACFLRENNEESRVVFYSAGGEVARFPLPASGSGTTKTMRQVAFANCTRFISQDVKNGDTAALIEIPAERDPVPANAQYWYLDGAGFAVGSVAALVNEVTGAQLTDTVS